MLGLAPAIFSLTEQTFLPRNESKAVTVGLPQPHREALKVFGKAGVSFCWTLCPSAFGEFFREALHSDPQPVAARWRAALKALLYSTFLQISGCSLRVAGSLCNFSLYQRIN